MMSVSRSATRQSSLFTHTRREAPAGEPSRNAQLLERAGFVSKLQAGVYSFLPLGLRVLRNVEKIIREEMDALGAAEILMPALHPIANWETTGREELDILFHTGIGDRRMVLGPTHEEVVTPLVASHVTSYRDLPVAVYQIQQKFRKEARPKSGLLRGREFGMKDMYSFHLSEASLDEFYERARQAYTRVFERCGLGDVTYFTAASGGSFSEFSHEFQAVTPYGEDTIYIDRSTDMALNKEVIDRYTVEEIARLDQVTAIEVGNIFRLGTKFSEAFGMTIPDASGQRMPVYMGCYGIGTSRLMGSIAEILSTESTMIWPDEVAPYGWHILPLSQDDRVAALADDVAALLEDSGAEVLVDDRSVNAGAKLKDADLIGIPRRVVIGSRGAAAGLVEFKDVRTDLVKELTLGQFGEVCGHVSAVKDVR